MNRTEKKGIVATLSELNVLIILAIIAFVAAVLTWILPAGTYESVLDSATGRMIVDPNSFQYIESTPVGLGGYLTSFHRGTVQAGYIVSFLLIIGGSFGIMNSTGTMASLTAKILTKFKSNASKEFIICIMVTLFAFGGAVWGWALECFAFAPFLMILMIALGYDALMGVAICAISYNVGYHAAFINPFGLGIAQNIAEVPYLSGMGLRLVIFIVMDLLTCVFFIHYGRKIQKDPTKSYCYGIEYDFSDSEMLDPEKVVMTKKQKMILVIFTLTIAFLIFGAMKLSWFITEIGTLFLVMGVVMGLVYGYGINETANKFVEGAKDMLLAALIIGFSNSIIIIMEDANILHTIIHGLVVPLNGLPAIVCAPIMVIVHTIINFFIVSSSGQAVVAMPIMTPVADLLGISRQVAVLAYQFGDGISDILFFTCGAVTISVGLAKISLTAWCKFVFKFFLWITLLSMAIVTAAQYFGW